MELKSLISSSEAEAEEQKRAQEFRLQSQVHFSIVQKGWRQELQLLSSVFWQDNSISYARNKSSLGAEYLY
jgi:hypothetical protein